MDAGDRGGARAAGGALAGGGVGIEVHAAGAGEEIGHWGRGGASGAAQVLMSREAGEGEEEFGFLQTFQAEHYRERCDDHVPDIDNAPRHNP